MSSHSSLKRCFWLLPIISYLSLERTSNPYSDDLVLMCTLYWNGRQPARCRNVLPRVRDDQISGVFPPSPPPPTPGAHSPAKDAYALWWPLNIRSPSFPSQLLSLVWLWADRLMGSSCALTAPWGQDQITVTSKSD